MLRFPYDLKGKGTLCKEGTRKYETKNPKEKVVR